MNQMVPANGHFELSHGDTSVRADGEGATILATFAGIALVILALAQLVKVLGK